MSLQSQWHAVDEKKNDSKTQKREHQWFSAFSQPEKLESGLFLRSVDFSDCKDLKAKYEESIIHLKTNHLL